MDEARDKCAIFRLFPQLNTGLSLSHHIYILLFSGQFDGNTSYMSRFDLRA